ncbi:glycosyltransferase [Candidatus Saccharibacteria bacterium]|nr:glycosyltransferase [Candidatus Saccharibacteria bacterium]MBI3338047.1 glycosyltransferase [Candidatus Saccharibacteria bacterium]
MDFIRVSPVNYQYMKVTIVTCYKDPDYVRARTLRAGLAANAGVEMTIVKNKHKNILRYPETIIRLVIDRINNRPDAYILTFRGYEILPFLQLIAWSKPIIFDEFINPLEWLAEPRHEKWVGLIPKKALKKFYVALLGRCRFILADTQAHADYSVKLSGQQTNVLDSPKTPRSQGESARAKTVLSEGEVALATSREEKPFVADRIRSGDEGVFDRSSKYWAIPVGTDETVFDYKLDLRKIARSQGKSVRVGSGFTEGEVAISTLKEGRPLPAEISWSGDGGVLRKSSKVRVLEKYFQVFYYGNMLPLHGLEYVLEAAVLLKNNQNIKFLIVGGNSRTVKMIKNAQQQGAKIKYQNWIPFEELPKVIATSSLCLGGPFGKTNQAQKVITGKTYQFLASGAATLIGNTEASALFIDKKNSLVVPLADPLALATTIDWAYQHRQQLPAIGQAGNRLYQENFSVRIITGELSAILTKLASGMSNNRHH